MIPCVNALLPDKTQVTDALVFRELLNINGNLPPISVLIDFELGSKNALEAVVLEAPVKGCFFHFTQNIWKKIQENGLQVRYQQDPAFVTEATMIVALSFVPDDDVNRVFNTLSSNIDQALDVILDYLRTITLGFSDEVISAMYVSHMKCGGVHDHVQKELTANK